MGGKQERQQFFVSLPLRGGSEKKNQKTFAMPG
jgi:hypothetical protein